MTARDVRKQSARHDLFHRLHSIASDCRFVERVAHDWYGGKYDVVANQRCGSWYCDATASAGTFAYFKSTDGHTNNWDFSLRRSNLSLALLSEQKGGLILVDSTRRGKRMPDALSKTVPIWCAVINLAISRSSPAVRAEGWDTALYTPPNVVSPSEKSQIEALLPLWADSLLASSLPLPTLTKPLRPFFIHPSTSKAPVIPPNAPFTPIICLSASRWVGGEDDIPSFTRLGDRTVAFEYVQGAGDDDELWARGLTPAVFHRHRTHLLGVERDDLPDEVDRLVDEAKASTTQLRTTCDKVHSSATGIPSPDSLLGLAIGPPVSAQPLWSPASPSGPILIVKVVEPSKADVPKSPDDDYILPLSHRSSDGNPDEAVVLILADPRVAGWAFGQGLQHAIRYLRPLIESGRRVLLVPGNESDLKAAFHLRDSQKEDSDDLVDAVEKLKLANEPSVDDRKRVVPLAVALLCSIPELHPEADTETRTAVAEGRVDKVLVGDMLHRLVALWPDANPPRAALKRINEVMMGDSHA